MATVKYQMMPTLKQWRADSSVTLAIRNKDSVLCRIDALLNEFYSPGPLFVGVKGGVKGSHRGGAKGDHFFPSLAQLSLSVWGRLERSPATPVGRRG
jgi:hypothetical protein